MIRSAFAFRQWAILYSHRAEGLPKKNRNVDQVHGKPFHPQTQVKLHVITAR